jgi:microcystin-dependent protein
MSDPYLGEIRMFAGNFAPRNNAYCSGQLLNIAQNSALFSLLGTAYGGDGRTTFGLPDLRGRLPGCVGQGPGLSDYDMGHQAGTESVTLTTAQMPVHNHLMLVSSNAADRPTPTGNMPAALNAPYRGLWVNPDKTAGTPLQMNENALASVGGGQPHENRMPVVAIGMIIALYGVFPSRN